MYDNDYFLLEGNVAQDFEIRKGKEDKEFAFVSIGVNHNKNNVDFFEFVCFDKFSLNRLKKVKKGDGLVVKGYHRVAKNSDGKPYVQFVATSVKALARYSKENENEEDNYSIRNDDPELNIADSEEF